MIRLRTAPNATLENYLGQWLVTHTAWSEASNNVPEAVTDGDGTEFMTADWRFAWGDNSKEVLLANLVAYARSYAPWGVVGYHRCDHDADTPKPCPPMDYGLPGGFGASIQSGVWGDPPATIDPREDHP